MSATEQPGTILDAVIRVREWAAAEPTGLILRRDVVGTLDRVLALSPERAAELSDYRGRIARVLAILHESSEYAISDALAGRLTRILSDPPARRTEPPVTRREEVTTMTDPESTEQSEAAEPEQDGEKAEKAEGEQDGDTAED